MSAFLGIPLRVRTEGPESPWRLRVQVGLVLVEPPRRAVWVDRVWGGPLTSAVIDFPLGLVGFLSGGSRAGWLSVSGVGDSCIQTPVHALLEPMSHTLLGHSVQDLFTVSRE